MPGHPRKDIVREGEIGVFHCWSRCVQRAMLCGEDPVTGRNFDHRRAWIQSLLEYQAKVFAVDVGNYSILSNHQHLIARTRPDIAKTWSDEDVAWRWKLAWPRWIDGQWIREPTDQEIEKVLSQPERIPLLRANLASLSWFMARWKEPIAKMANRESETKGHHYEQRYGCRELVDDAAEFCAFVYVDLNLLKARMAASLEECKFSAIYDRIMAWRQEQAQQSLDKFHANCPEGYELSHAAMGKLLADCSLAPIGDKGPLILLDSRGAYLTSTPNPPQIIIPEYFSGRKSDVESRENVPPPPDPVDANPAPVAPDAPSVDKPPEKAGDPSSTTTSKPKPTWKIHRRLQQKRRHRASDNPILGLPRQQYLQIVELAAKQFLDPQSKPPPELEAMLRERGVEPSQWRVMMEHFDTMFHGAVGKVENLSPILSRVGQKWLQGLRACRDVFT